jgi:hypothetical protein
MSVDQGFARWLREGAYFAEASDAQVAGMFAQLARVSEIVSTLALKAGAEAEAARQLAFLKWPLAIDTHLVPGLRADLIGQPVAIRGDRLGYDAAPTVFVIGVAEQDGTDQTLLTVLRKLA